MARHDGVKMLVLVSLLLILHNACVCLCRNRSSSSICYEEERDALIQFRQNLSDTSHILSPWNSEDCCQWTEVKCDQVNGHVIMLQITSGSDFGSISFTASDLNSSLLNLRYLSYLELSGIFFKNANILKFTGLMKPLRYLNLSNSFGFSIPRNWGNLTELEVLDLHTYFSMDVEDIQWVSHLQALKYLDMSGFNIIGSRDHMQVISKLPSLSHLSLSSCGIYEVHLSTSLHLQYLDLSYNFLRHHVLSTIFQNMTSLRHLDFSGTSFEGPIPSTIFQSMISLRYLDFSWTSFEGPIPSTIFQNMTSLRYLDFSVTSFKSPISSIIFQNMTSLWHLDLSRSSFKGLIPSTIFQSLTSLRHLDLSLSNFNGTIPSTIFQNMTSLWYLDLSWSFLKGPIPSTIFHGTTSLRHIDLSSNLFESPIPGTIFHGMTSLRHIDLSSNLFGSPIPSTIVQNMTSLQHLDLSSNLFKSPIPCTIVQNMTSLQHLDLSMNFFNSSIPRCFDNLISLVDLNLAQNLLQSIEGGLSSLLRNKPFLRSLLLDQNELHEEIFSIEGNYSGLIGKNLEQLVINNNFLWGALPNWLGHLKKLTILDLSHNQLTGDIPEALGRLQVLLCLDLSNNLLNGTVPHSLGQLQDLDYLDLSANSLRGTLSEIHFSNFSITGALPDFYNRTNGSFPKFLWNLHLLNLSHNLISGPIPQDVGLAMPNLNYLYLNDNLLNGPIPTSLCEMELEVLHLGRNELVGKIPACWKEGKLMSILDLSSNKLSGVIPSSLGNLIRLGSIHLNNNSLHGEIPLTLNYCRNLLILDLGENKISGSVPHWFGPSFQILQILRLRENMFNGSIPSRLCLLPALQILDLAVNNLTGMIPNCLGYMNGMQLHKSRDNGNSHSPAFAPASVNGDGMVPAMTPTDWNQMHVEQVVKGIDLDYTTIDLQLMVNLDLSSNKLTGRIPEELTLLSKLRGLNLSRNFLSGGIPSRIGYMKSLESLDLSNNVLSGTIPQSFSAFTSLSKLNLSHNNFMGPIPKGNQIQTLDDPSIYADNPLLCGDPLKKKCLGAEAPQSPEEDTDEERKLEKVMFCVVIMLGFATGFWGVIGVLVYKKNWRRVYFNYVDCKTDMVCVIVVVKAAELRRRLRRA